MEEYFPNYLLLLPENIQRPPTTCRKSTSKFARLFIQISNSLLSFFTSLFQLAKEVLLSIKIRPIYLQLPTLCQKQLPNDTATWFCFLHLSRTLPLQWEVVRTSESFNNVVVRSTECTSNGLHVPSSNTTSFGVIKGTQASYYLLLSGQFGRIYI